MDLRAPNLEEASQQSLFFIAPKNTQGRGEGVEEGRTKEKEIKHYKKEDQKGLKTRRGAPHERTIAAGALQGHALRAPCGRRWPAKAHLAHPEPALKAQKTQWVLVCYPTFSPRHEGDYTCAH